MKRWLIVLTVKFQAQVFEGLEENDRWLVSEGKEREQGRIQFVVTYDGQKGVMLYSGNAVRTKKPINASSFFLLIIMWFRTQLKDIHPGSRTFACW